MEWLREAREGREPPLSQRGLAKLAGVSSALVSQAESGRRISRVVVEMLAGALGVDVDQALARSGYAPDWLLKALAERPESLERLRKELRR